ncbi:MAG: response regulator [Halanaerobiales bacterium]
MSPRLLIIEDNEMNLELLQEMLKSEDYRNFTTCRDGEQGIEKIRETKPDLILLDVQLPGKSGYEIAAYVRGDPELREISIIGVTAYGTREDKRTILDSGFDAYVAKPVNMEELITTIDNLLN